MPTFVIQVEVCDVYEKFVEADSREDVLNLIADEVWGSSERGWERLDGSAEVLYAEPVQEE